MISETSMAADWLDYDEKAEVGITVLSQLNDEGLSREFTGDNVPTNAKGIGKDA